jgi:SHS2 domain-containing protein
MDKKIKFEFLEHTADVYIASYGETIKEAFENAAIALFEVMTDTKKIELNLEDSILVKAKDEQGLLYNWLEALLVNFEIKNRVYSKFKILSFKKNTRSFSLKAKIWGETFDPKKHLQKVGVKAVTYHRMEIIKDQNGVTLEFILDI